MSIRIAIPEPTSDDVAYNDRTLPDYISALQSVGLLPVVISLKVLREDLCDLLSDVHGVLLPGSGYDVAPEKYGEPRMPECGPTDSMRGVIDTLLLEDAFAKRKPVLGICHGTQSLNVWRHGSLIQDVGMEVGAQVNHRPDRSISDAHMIGVGADSRLGQLLPDSAGGKVLVNSSHHQSIRVAGDGLRVTAVSPCDGVVEAIELKAADHFVLGVQWHPERTYHHSSFSRAIFAAFSEAAFAWRSPSAS